MSPPVDVIIPALNEAHALGLVLAALPRQMLRDVWVVDNGSTDETPRVARRHGAGVLFEPRRGYGSACLAGVAQARRSEPQPEAVVFLDADYSDHPQELPRLLTPILEDRADLVVGSRVLGRREPGALPPHARFGNWLAAILIHRAYGLRITDLGPFRAIRWRRLLELDMRDPDFGWTVEMQVKAALLGLRYSEVPVSYRRRLGRSKISGTLGGSLRAGRKILSTIFALRSFRAPS